MDIVTKTEFSFGPKVASSSLLMIYNGYSLSMSVNDLEIAIYD